MTSEQFVFWLRGFLMNEKIGEEGLNLERVKIIINVLNEVKEPGQVPFYISSVYDD